MYTHFIIILKNISFLYYLILTAIALSLYTENEMKKIKKKLYYKVWPTFL